MKYVISALITVLALVSCAGAFTGNDIIQTNYEEAHAFDSGTVTQKEANWAVVCGDGNYLNQDNDQYGQASSADIKMKATNIALLVGIGNHANQMNDPKKGEDPKTVLPSYIDVTQMNELLVIGTANSANQENDAAAAVGNEGKVTQDQNNFGVIFGTANTLNQSNFAYGTDTGKRSAKQTEANAAYLYGEINRVSQSNTLMASAEACEGLTNQTAKNLAFAISSCPTIEFIPGCEAFSLKPGCSNSEQTLNCPGIPEVPCPPAMEIEWQLDP